MGTAANVGDAVNLKKNVGDSPVKRTYAKLRHPAKAQVSGQTAERAQDEEFDQEEEHITTEHLAGSAGRGVAKEALQYFQSDEGEADLRKVYLTMVDIANQVLLSDELKETSRMAGREIVTGASEGLARTLVPQWEKLPKAFTGSVLLIVAIFGGLFMLGLLLALWRFALFGLQS